MCVVKRRNTMLEMQYVCEPWFVQDEEGYWVELLDDEYWEGLADV